MANILGIFTAIILAVAAFVAVKNKSHFEEEIAIKEREEKNLKISQERLKDAQADLNRLPIERAEVDAQFAAKSEEEAQLKQANEDLKSKIDSDLASIADNKEKAADLLEKTKKLGNIRDLASTMKTTSLELEELAQNIDSSEAELANLTAENTSAQAEATRRKLDLDMMSKGISLPSLKTRIRNIYPSWGFVTLADGNNAGVIASSSLDVVRDGVVIARLLVSGVESGSASASVIPDSIVENVTLMVGDRVVAESQGPKRPAGN